MKPSSVYSLIALTLLPWSVVWLGLYVLKSTIGTFALYHGLCLLPAVVTGRHLWRHQLTMPSKKELGGMVAALISTPALAIGLERLTGELIVSKKYLLDSLHGRGYTDDMLIPVSLYLILVNGPLEEFFWRGIIFNLKDKIDKTNKLTAGEPSASSEPRPFTTNCQTQRFTTEFKWELWTAVSFAGWHVLVLQMLLNPPWAIPVTISFSFVGYFLGWLMKKSGSLVLVSLWHGLVFDGAVIAVFLDVLARKN